MVYFEFRQIATKTVPSEPRRGQRRTQNRPGAAERGSVSWRGPFHLGMDNIINDE